MNMPRTRLAHHVLALVAGGAATFLLLILTVSLINPHVRGPQKTSRNILLSEQRTAASSTDTPDFAPLRPSGTKPAVAKPTNLDLPSRGDPSSLHIPAVSLSLSKIPTPSLGDISLAPQRMPAFDSPVIPRYVPAGPLIIPNLNSFYPKRASASKIGGRSLVRIRVDADGKVIFAETVSSVPEGVFDEAAKSASLAGACTPARQDGVAVESERVVELEWDPGDRE